MKWRTDRLGNVVTLKRGYDLPESKRVEGDIPVVSSSGIFGSHNEKKVDGPGVVTGRYGTIGEVFYIEDPYWPLNTSLYVQNFHGNDPRFISYFLRNHLKGIKSDKAAVPGVNRNDLHERQVKVPDVSSQLRIASILSAYDDLIANNRRRIQLLEQAARHIYKEWFVRLRFPGHEHTRIADGVPVGWEQKTAYEVMEIQSGGTPSTKVPNYWDGEIPFYTPKDYTDSPYVLETERTITEDGLAKCSSRLYPKNTVFISARGTVGKIIMPQRPMAMSQTSYALSGKNGVSQLFLYSALQAGLQQFQQRATGAVFDAIVVDTFKLIPFVLPPQKLIDDFERLAEPTFAQIENLLLMNQKLTQARDLLLPRLMSGALDPKGLEDL